MKLIINKELDNINDSVNIKIIEITSTDFLNNDLDYFVYKYQIPLIKFSDTEEIFNIKNFKNNLNSSLAETLIIIDETDLELLSNGSGGGGGSQDLQSVLNAGNTALGDILLSNTTNEAYTYRTTVSPDTGVLSEVKTTNPNSNDGARSSVFIGFDYSRWNNIDQTWEIKASLGGLLVGGVSSGMLTLNNGVIDTTLRSNPSSTAGEEIFLPLTLSPTHPSYGNPRVIAALDDLLVVGTLIPTYENNAAAISGGLVVNKLYKTATGEIRVVV